MNKYLKELSNFVFSLVEVSLIIRFLLKLFGANTQSQFVSFIYQNTIPLLSPFLLAFPSPNVNGKFILEFTTLFAIFVYAFVSYLVQDVLDFLNKKSK
ncbi:MAG: YggT family protein [Pseudomonadales bacterium]|nr:YggT family protein [Pseudomonadales bacterium]